MSPSYDVQDDRIVIDDLSQIGRWGSVELYYPDNWDPATNILTNDGFSEADQPDVIDISNATLDGAPLSQYLVGTPAGATGGEEFINSYFVDGVDNNSVILQLYYHAVGTDEEFIGLDAIILASFDEAADLDWTLEFDYVAKWDGLASEDTGHVTLEIGIGPIEPDPGPGRLPGHVRRRLRRDQRRRRLWIPSRRGDRDAGTARRGGRERLEDVQLQP